MGASWLTQRGQFNAQERASQLTRREELYKAFIEEASKLYADAYEHDEANVSNLVGLYAMVSRMRVLSSPEIVTDADNVVRLIIDTYLAPNKTFKDVTEIMDDETLNPMRDFSNACREELWGRRAKKIE